MYTEFYGFTEKPFNLVPDPNYLYLSSRHGKALTFLEYGLSEKVGFVMLTGEVGTGKTTLIRYLLNQVESDMEVAVIFHTNVDSFTLFRQILNEFDIGHNETMDKADLLDLLYDFLIQQYSSNRRVFVIIDEAQNLSNDAFEEIRMLSNLQTDKEMLLQIIIVGQPQLKDKIKAPGLEQFAQRISASYHISGMTLEETASYIAHRLGKASGPVSLFKQSLIERIFILSNGIPRTINMLCDALLVYGYADRAPLLTTKLLDQVVEDKEGMGVFMPNSTQAPPCLLPDENDHTDLMDRIRDLEARVAHLTDAFESRIQETQSRADDCRKNLVLKLSRLYQTEKKKTETLIYRYGKLQEKYDALQLERNKRSEPILLEKIVQ